ncbi:MAG TPA: hypothetical protein VI454_07915 [Verrucomicrobiae bacterium]|jgi:uncharacterized membrane protein
MSYYELIVLGLVCFLAPWLAKMADYSISRKSFDLVGIAGIFFLLGSAFGLGGNMVDMLRNIGNVFQIVSFVFGWIALAAGALWGLMDVLREPGHMFSHRKA